MASVKAGFHVIAKIAATAGKNVQQSLRIMWKPLFAIVAITAIIWKPAYMENAQRSKSRRPLSFFGSDRRDRSDRMETNINMYKVQNLCIVNLKGSKV